MHIPKQFSLKSLLEQFYGPNTAKRKLVRKPHTFKTTRAQKKHKETVLSAYQTIEQTSSVINE